MNIDFFQATKKDKPLIKKWWNKPHVKEFWDNSLSMWENVENYLDQGTKDIFDYWVGTVDGEPFALLMTSNSYSTHSTGTASAIDFMIGNKKYLGKGLAAPTLKAFMDFLPEETTCFLIDPAAENTRAVHVYSKAGFKEIDRFTPKEGSFKGKEHIMMKCMK